MVCPHNANFIPLLREVGGTLEVDMQHPLHQASFIMPWYIPVIDHGYSRQEPLKVPFAALDTYKLFKLKKGHYQAIADNAEELRAAFKLSRDTRIILRGIAKDPPLEEYWAYRKIDRVPEQLAKLDISLVIGPNFSMFLDVPRLDPIFNRKRQLICLAELADVGISVVPHLSAIMPGDWNFWRQLLTTHSNICYVAKEFQTGNRSRSEGQKAIYNLSSLQQAVGRSLHPLLVGGMQHVELAATAFSRLTVLDSRPFMNAVSRRSFDLDAEHGYWVNTPTGKGQAIDHILRENIARYGSYVDSRIAAAMSEYANGATALPSA
jgi:hypothetical protein